LFLCLHCLVQGWRLCEQVSNLLWCHVGSIA
jgi:hypothetical protein